MVIHFYPGEGKQREAVESCPSCGKPFRVKILIDGSDVMIENVKPEECPNNQCAFTNRGWCALQMGCYYWS